VQDGKQTAALRNAVDVDDACCFSIVSMNHVTLDLSGNDEDLVRSWIVYLRAHVRHYKEQMVEAKQKKRKESKKRGQKNNTLSIWKRARNSKF